MSPVCRLCAGMMTRRLEVAATHLMSSPSSPTNRPLASEIEIGPLQTHYIILIGQLHATATGNLAVDIWCVTGLGGRGCELGLF